MKCDTIPDLENFLRIQQQALGESREVAETICKLAAFYFKANDLCQAEALYRQALHILAKLSVSKGAEAQDIERQLEAVLEAKRPPEARRQADVKYSSGAERLPEHKYSPEHKRSPEAKPSPHVEESTYARQSADAKPSTHAKQSPDARPSADIKQSADAKPSPGQKSSFKSGEASETDAQWAEKLGGAISKNVAAAAMAASFRTIDESVWQQSRDSEEVQDEIDGAEIELQLLKDVVGPKSASVADQLTKLADLYCRLRKYDKVEQALLEALQIRESSNGADHPSVSTDLKNLARLYCLQEIYSKAEPLFRRAIEIRKTAFGANHPKVADIEKHYAVLLRRTGRLREAEDLEQHIQEIQH